MLSRTSQHALNVLRCLARDPAVRIPADTLARETGVPANYLSKVLDQLRKRAIVEGEKGWGGGFRLRREALDRRLGDIVAIFDGPERSRSGRCIFGLAPCDAENPCALHPQWERIRGVLHRVLETKTVRDLPTRGARRRKG